MKINEIIKNIRQLNQNYVTDNNKLYKNLLDELEKEIFFQKEDLLNKICNYYNLDVNKIKKKFLKKNKKKDYNKEETINQISEDLNQDVVLFKLNHNNNNYYIECIENGSVYDENMNIIGKYIDNNIILN